MKYRNYLRFVLVLAALLLSAAVSATTLDSYYGATVSNSALIRANNISGETYANAPDTYVALISGDTLAKPASEAATGNVGDTIVFTYTIHNTGNSGDSFSVSIVNDSYGYNSVGQTSSAWWVALYSSVGETVAGTALTANDSISVGMVDEDGIGVFYVAVGISPIAANAPNGSYWQVSFSVMSNTVATAPYTGDDAITPYAEATASAGQNNYGCDTVTVAGASFALIKSCTASFGGVDYVPQPGATLWFTIGYVNDGGGAGDSVAIQDALDTTVVTFSDTIVAGDSLATGWFGQYASAEGIYYADPADPNLVGGIKYLLWTKQTVAAAETARLRYRVFIK